MAAWATARGGALRGADAAVRAARAPTRTTSWATANSASSSFIDSSSSSKRLPAIEPRREPKAVPTPGTTDPSAPPTAGSADLATFFSPPMRALPAPDRAKFLTPLAARLTSLPRNSSSSASEATSSSSLASSSSCVAPGPPPVPSVTSSANSSCSPCSVSHSPAGFSYSYSYPYSVSKLVTVRVLSSLWGLLVDVVRRSEAVQHDGVAVPDPAARLRLQARLRRRARAIGVGTGDRQLAHHRSQPGGETLSGSHCRGLGGTGRRSLRGRGGRSPRGVGGPADERLRGLELPVLLAEPL